MNFIRNIISEKRAARPMAPPLSAPLEEGRSWDISTADHFETARTITDAQTDLSAQATTAAPINIFADQGVNENAGPAGNREPTGPAADHQDLCALGRRCGQPVLREYREASLACLGAPAPRRRQRLGFWR